MFDCLPTANDFRKGSHNRYQIMSRFQHYAIKFSNSVQFTNGKSVLHTERAILLLCVRVHLLFSKSIMVGETKLWSLAVLAQFHKRNESKVIIIAL